MNRTVQALLLICACMGADTCKAGNFFQACDTALKTRPFASLAAFVARQDGVIDTSGTDIAPQSCLRLNDHEFFVIPAVSGGSVGNLYHCDFKAGRACSPYGETGRIYPNTEVDTEFTDANGKHFALLASQTLKHGVFSQTYIVFYLADPRKTPDGVPFRLEDMASATNFSESDSDNGPCNSNLNGREYVLHTANAIGSARFTNDLTGNARLSFDITEEDCDTKVNSTYVREYSYRNGHFIEVSGARPPKNSGKRLH